MPTEYMRCPFCARKEWVSEEDPDSSFGEMLSHIRMAHSNENQAPAVLWPKIAVISE